MSPTLRWILVGLLVIAIGGAAVWWFKTYVPGKADYGADIARLEAELAAQKAERVNDARRDSATQAQNAAYRTAIAGADAYQKSYNLERQLAWMTAELRQNKLDLSGVLREFRQGLLVAGYVAPGDSTSPKSVAITESELRGATLRAERCDEVFAQNGQLTSSLALADYRLNTRTGVEIAREKLVSQTAEWSRTKGLLTGKNKKLKQEVAAYIHALDSLSRLSLPPP